MAFRFALESILKHRKRQEDIAQRDFLEAQAKVEECLRGIQSIYTSIDNTRISISAAEKSGTPNDLDFIRQADRFIEGQKVRVREERLKARELIRAMEDRQHELTERMHERKIMQNLKDKRLEEYQEEIKRIEQIELDDLVNSRWSYSGGRR